MPHLQNHMSRNVAFTMLATDVNISFRAVQHCQSFLNNNVRIIHLISTDAVLESRGGVYSVN